jgi:hypothetical protein
MEKNVLQYIKEQRLNETEAQYGKVLSYISESKIIVEENTNGNGAILGRIKAILMELNTKSQNGTYYDDAWYEKSIENNQSFQRRLAKKLILGHLDHPDKAATSGSLTAFAVVKIWREGNIVWGVLEIFNTKNGNGQDLWTLINAGVVIGFSLRGLGTDYYENGCTKIVGDGFDLKGWDAVVDASFINAEFKEFTEQRKQKMILELESKVNAKMSATRLILETIKMNKEKESKSNIDRFENTQLKDLTEKQKKVITVLEEKNKTESTLKNKVLEEKNSLITENLKLSDRIKQIESTQNNYKLTMESKDKTIVQLNSKLNEVENTKKLIEEQVKEKELLISKYLEDIENLKKVVNDNKINISINKLRTEDKKENKVRPIIGSYKYKIVDPLDK